MKTKKKESPPSRFTRGEKVTGKRAHGRKADKKEDSAYGQIHKADSEIPTA